MVFEQLSLPITLKDRARAHSILRTTVYEQRQYEKNGLFCPFPHRITDSPLHDLAHTHQPVRIDYPGDPVADFLNNPMYPQLVQGIDDPQFQEFVDQDPKLAFKCVSGRANEVAALAVLYASMPSQTALVTADPTFDLYNKSLFPEKDVVEFPLGNKSLHKLGVPDGLFLAQDKEGFWYVKYVVEVTRKTEQARPLIDPVANASHKALKKHNYNYFKHKVDTLEYYRDHPSALFNRAKVLFVLPAYSNPTLTEPLNQRAQIVQVPFGDDTFESDLLRNLCTRHQSLERERRKYCASLERRRKGTATRSQTMAMA